MTIIPTDSAEGDTDMDNPIRGADKRAYRREGDTSARFAAIVGVASAGLYCLFAALWALSLSI
jgi:hypothetical protein